MISKEEFICLNNNDRRVQDLFNTIGEEETYRQYVLNNGVIPENILIPFSDVKEYLNDFIPTDNFEFQPIKKILSQTPAGTQAAFWRNVFYFKDAVSKQEVNEELFHSVVSTILTPEERSKLYSEGAKLFNVKERTKEFIASYPETYSLLSKEDQKNRVIEEHLASLFVNSFEEPSLFNKLSDFIKNIFDTIKSLFGFARNRYYVETVFNNIKTGKYRNSPVFISENATPSTYIIKGATPLGILQPLGEVESEQVLRNLRAVYFDLKQNSDKIFKQDLIKQTIDVAREYYNEVNPVVSGAFTSTSQVFNFETGQLEDVDNTDYLELIETLQTRIEEVEGLMFDPIEEDGGDNTTDENADSEYQHLGDLTKDATETGFDSISRWLKMYISTVGNVIPVQIAGQTYNFIEAVDPARIYYGVARALNNSTNDFERFIKLVEFGELQGNSAAKAFRDKVIKDVTGKNNSKETIQAIQNDYLNEYLVKKDPSIINNHIAPSRAYVLQNVLKGFDLWTRTNLFSTISPETGTSSTFNANVNNAVNNQMNQWRQSYNEYNDVSKLDGLIGSVGVTSTYNETLEESVEKNVELLQDAIGVNVSEEAVRWLLINNTRNAPLSASQITKYNAFKSQIQTFDTAKEISSLLENIKSYAKQSGDIFDDGGIKKRLKLLAQINAVFDESVFESSYKTADGKTRYGFQWKTFDLEFINNLQNPEFLTSLMNNGLVNYRVDDKGNKIYLNESQDFLRNNIFLKDMFEEKNGKYELKDTSLLPYMKLASVDGIRQREGKDNSEIDDVKEQIAKAVNAGNRTLANELIEKAKTLESNESQGREGEGSTFTNMLTKDFNLLRLNYVVNETVKVGNTTLFPHYLGNLEAKRTADFVYLPELKNVVDNKGITNRGISLLKEEIRKEYDRIKRVHQELKSLMDAHPEAFIPNADGEIKLSSQRLRDYLKKDIYEKYHTGTVIKSGDVYLSKGVRALEFSDSVLGILPKELMKELLIDAALNNKELLDVWNENNLDNSLTSHWREIFKLHYDKLVEDENLPNLDRRWKINGELDRVKFANFILGSYLNVLSFNQLMHGDPALVYKNDGADMYKRFGGRNAAIQSSETYLINPDLGITEVKNQIRYVVGNEFVNRVSFSPSNTIDQADAQNYSTTEYKRYLLWSRGKLTKFLANALDKIDVGIPLTMEEQKMMQDANEFLNVDKTVAFNGVQYLKKSDFMLTKELTSVLSLDALERLANLEPFSKEAFDIRRDENNWIARKDFEFHHYLRQTMEGWRTQSGALVKNNSKRFDLYMPISASKMLNINVFDPSTISEENGWNNIDGSVMQIAAKNYGLQLENPAGKRAIIDPSQMIEIIFNEQSDTAEVVHNGEIKKIVSLEEEYQKYLTSRDNTMLDLAYDQLFDENDEFDAESFFPKAVKSLIKSGADPQTIQVFQSIEDGKPLLNPNIGITKDQFTNLIFAHITKGVLQQKVNGDALAHVSSYGITPIKQIRKIKIGDKFDYTWDVVRRDSDVYNSIIYGAIHAEKLELEKQFDKENPRVIYDPTLESDVLREKLKELYESGVEYFTDELRHIKPRYEYSDHFAGDENERGYSVVKYDKPTGYFTESLMPSSDPDMDIIGSNKYSFAVRIPSQDKHSAVNIEWIDTLPFYYGNSVITAKEIIFLSGSDFDIDKLFVHKPHLYKYRGKWTLYGKGDEWVEYIEFLKSFSPEFAKEYNSELKAIRQQDEEMNEEYNTVRERIRDIRESGQQVPKELVQQIKDFEAEYKIQKEYVDNWKPTELLKKYRFPLEIEGFQNPYAANNELLVLKQLALNNDGTLLGEDAISKTPASMDSMKHLDEGELFQKDGDSVFRKSSILPAHIFNTHSDVHEKNTTGKQNINPYVNGNLGLIAAIRGKYHINKDFQFTLNGHKAEFFNYRNQENQRVFDILSTLISSATDEAKEQLNARYNLNIDGAVLAKTLISLGYSFQTSILFVNQPTVQEYLRQKQNKQKTIFLEKQYKSDEEILASIPTLPVDVEEITDELLSEWMLENKYVSNVIPVLQIIEKINSQLSLLTRFQKVKKGFSGGLQQLDQLNDAITSLGIRLEEESAASFNKNNPINTPKYAEDAIQMNNVINKIAPKVNKISRKLLFGRQSVVKEIKDRVVSQFRNLSIDEAYNVERDIDSYISMRLYLEENDVPVELLTNNLFKRGDSHQTVGQTFNKLKEDVAKINREGAKSPDEERLGSLYGTSILKRLIVKERGEFDELTLDSFAKLSPEEQDTLITSFEVMIKNLAYLSDDMLEYKSLPQQMFAYWVMKEGFQYRFGSVSKLFPLHMFKTHSNTMDKVLSGKKLDSISALSQYGFRDVMTRFAQNSETRKLIKKFYNPVIKGVPTIHNNNFEYDIAKLNELNDDKVRANYPFKYDVKGNVEEIPFYTKSQYGVPLELSIVTLQDGGKLYRESPTFYNDVLENIMDGNVSKVQYFNIKNTNSETFQSIMTVDMNYTGLIKQEFPPVEIQENQDNNIKGCDNSF